MEKAFTRTSPNFEKYKKQKMVQVRKKSSCTNDKNKNSFKFQKSQLVTPTFAQFNFINKIMQTNPTSSIVQSTVLQGLSQGCGSGSF